MKRILSSLFLALFFAALARAIGAGDAEGEVRIARGNPVAVRKKPDGSEVWRFKNGTTVWLAGGIVQKITGPTAGNSVRRAASMDWVPLLLTTPPIATQGERESPAAEDRLGVRYFVFFGGLAVIVGLLGFGMILLRDGGGWLLSRAFVPLVSSASAALMEGRFGVKRSWRVAGSKHRIQGVGPTVSATES
jgi:hypothetical protein